MAHCFNIKLSKFPVQVLIEFLQLVHFYVMLIVDTFNLYERIYARTFNLMGLIYFISIMLQSFCASTRTLTNIFWINRNVRTLIGKKNRGKKTAIEDR